MAENRIIKFYLCLCVAVSALSCVEYGQDAPMVLQDYPVMLTASGDPDTRIGLKDKTDIMWEADDKIRITAVAADGDNGTSELSVYEIDEEDNGKAEFSGFISMLSMPQDCYFTYPVGEAMKVDVSSGILTARFTEQTGGHKPFMYAGAEYSPNGMEVKMEHLGAMLEIDVTGVKEKSGEKAEIVQISFAGNRLEKLSPLNMNLKTGAYSWPQEANTQITVPVQENGKTYICVPPMNFEKGFSLVLTKADGSAMVKSYSSDGTIAGGYDFTGKKGHIIPIDITGTFEGFGITCSVPVAEHKKSGGLLTGTSVSFTMTMTGAPDKIIDEWGATLVRVGDNENDVGKLVVRKIALKNTDLHNGASVTMDVMDDWKLLPAGNYVFTPYYKWYGDHDEISIEEFAKTVEVKDPGITLVLTGETSYDKYLAGRTGEANDISRRTFIDGVGFTTNLHPDILSYSAKLNGTDLGIGYSYTETDRVISYGNKEFTSFGSYPYEVTLHVGAWHNCKSAERNFHITGLPYEADFTKSNPTDMNPAWYPIGTTYKNSRVVYNSDGLSGVRSPKFFIPEPIKVMVAADSRHNVLNWWNYSCDMLVAPCDEKANTVVTDNSVTIKLGKDYYQSPVTDVDSFKSKGYLYSQSNLELSPSQQCLMFSVNITTSYTVGNLAVSFKHKIEYSSPE